MHMVVFISLRDALWRSLCLSLIVLIHNVLHLWQLAPLKVAMKIRLVAQMTPFFNVCIVYLWTSHLLHLSNPAPFLAAISVKTRMQWTMREQGNVMTPSVRIDPLAMQIMCRESLLISHSPLWNGHDWAPASYLVVWRPVLEIETMLRHLD